MVYRNKEEEYEKIPIDVESLIESISGDMIEKEKCLKDAVAVFEKTFVDMVLEKVEGDIKRASSLLKVDSKTLGKIVNLSK